MIHLSVYTVRVKKAVIKQLRKCPEVIQILFDDLVEDLERKGPIQPEWPNYSGLSKNRYHCHLKHSWVACWYCEKDSIEIEVYYAGSRESAPY
jgi:hypothetical protein